MSAANRGLEGLMRATVRVDEGTGVLVTIGASTVVITAKHVVTSDGKVRGPVRVRRGTDSTDCSVLAQDEGSDLAVLSAPPSLDGDGLELMVRELVPGEEVWTAGHPRGWASTDTPVLCRGIVAGVAEERWANLEGTWGNSGGALTLITEDQHAVLGGVALGRAGKTHEKLDDLRVSIVQDGPAREAVLEKITFALAGLDAALSDENREFLNAASARSPDAKKVQQARELLERVEALQRLQPEIQKAAELTRNRMEIDASQAATLSTLTDLVDRHFRTGFLRFAGVTVVRKLLGNG